ncbi:MAG: DNA gyrase modulator, partial [Castellaniella sp.]
MNSNNDDFLDVPAQQAQFRELVGDALRYAKQAGATDAAAEISESRGLSVSVRRRAIETIEQTRDRSMAVTVFAGQRRGSASTSDFSAEALRRTVDAAWHIARYTAEDPAAGLPEPELFARHYPDLDLHHPWAIDAEGAARLAIQAERAALATSKQITNSEGASLDTMEGHFVLGNSRGFLGGYPYSRHSLSVAPIAGRGDGMQRDYWYTSARRADGLSAPAEVGRYAAERALSRLNARPVKTGHYPVLFEAPLA